MVDDTDKFESAPEPAFAQDLRWSRKNTIVFAAGVGALAAGYVFLALARRDISALAGRLSPFLIMVGYLIVIGSVLIDDKRGDQKEDKITSDE